MPSASFQLFKAAAISRTESMASFRNRNVEIAYFDEGWGEPIVLVHGFASTKEVNWVAPGWVTTLTRAGRRVIALDLEMTEQRPDVFRHDRRVIGGRIVQFARRAMAAVVEQIARSGRLS